MGSLDAFADSNTAASHQSQRREQFRRCGESGQGHWLKAHVPSGSNLETEREAATPL